MCRSSLTGEDVPWWINQWDTGFRMNKPMGLSRWVMNKPKSCRGNLRVAGRHGLTGVPSAELWDGAVLQVDKVEESCRCRGNERERSQRYSVHVVCCSREYPPMWEWRYEWVKPCENISVNYLCQVTFYGWRGNTFSNACCLFIRRSDAWSSHSRMQ